MLEEERIKIVAERQSRRYRTLGGSRTLWLHLECLERLETDIYNPKAH